MIIAEVKADLLTSECQTLVCPVNTVGAMGKGLALDFKNKFKGLYPAYQEACRSSVFRHKGIFVFDYRGAISPDKKILCLPTKKHWSLKSKLHWVHAGLETIAHDYEQYGITSLAIPAVGCGQGSLVWDDVYTLIRETLGPIDLPVTIYLP